MGDLCDLPVVSHRGNHRAIIIVLALSVIAALLIIGV